MTQLALGDDPLDRAAVAELVADADEPGSGIPYRRPTMVQYLAGVFTQMLYGAKPNARERRAGLAAAEDALHAGVIRAEIEMRR